MTRLAQAPRSSQTPIYPFEQSLRWTFRALELTPEIPTAFESLRHQLKGDTSTTEIRELITDLSHLGNIVWFWVDKISTQDRALLFLEEIYNVSKEVRDAIFGASLASETLPFILDQLWLLEDKKPAESQNRNTLIEIYDRALEFAEQHDILVLRVAAARAKAITLSDIEKGLDSAETVMTSLPLPNDDNLVAWINITLALLHNDFGKPENARSYLEKVIELPGSVADQWCPTMRKHLMVAYSKLGLWEAAKRQGILALKETRESTHPQYSRLEILGELAFIHWNIGDNKRTCGTLYAIYLFLQRSDQFSIEEFNEIYNKFAYAMRWYATSGSQSSFDFGGKIDLRPIEPGFFSRSLPNLRTYEHEQGNTLLGPAALLNFLAVETDAHRIAWRLWLQIKRSEEFEGTFFKFFTQSHGASLEARFGSPTQAVEYGISSFKLKSLSQRSLDLNSPRDLFQQASVDTSWNILSDEQQASYETLLLYEVLIPLFIELIARNASKNQIVEILQEYRVSMRQHVDLHSYKSFQQTIDHFEQLLLARANGISVAISKTDVEMVDLLGILSTYDISSNVGIQDKLRVQATIAAHIWEHRRYIPIKHTMYGLGRLLHSFWTNVVKNQRFLISQPNIMETRLKKTSHCRSEKTVAEVLSIAADGVDLRLEGPIKDFIRQVVESTG